MKKVLIIGCPGAGKSTFGRALAAKTGLPLYYLDMIWHRSDRTTVSREEFDIRLSEIMERPEWIIDGNYKRTLPVRLSEADTVFFLDYPIEVCMQGAVERLGKPRPDIPWDGSKDCQLDEEFRQWILDYPKDQLPVIRELLKSYPGPLFIFHSREEADRFLKGLKRC
ncbi:MAG: hypothetical protein K2L00_08160 [Muribaculaceae bacterium]|nr:hypothetical protein [Muribaculaceae bacterium]